MSTAMPRERGDIAAVDRSADPIAAIETNVARVIRGKPTAIRHAVVALIARGHLLIEDVPGVGKTTLARAVATSIGGTFHRIQFTSDLLPSDIVGVSVLDAKTGRFEFHPGAIFANLVLAVEIPFMVVATQNPEEHYGTYPLPESQMDRFLLRIRIEYPAPDDERRILLESPGRASDALAAISAVLRVADVRALQEAADRVHFEAELADYVIAVARETRRSAHLTLG